LDKALRGLQAIADERGLRDGPVAIPDPNSVIDDLLADVSADASGPVNASTRTVDVSQLAALSITFDVI